jgi:hypothetical protein
MEIANNVPSLCDVAKIGNEYFRLQIEFMRIVNVNLLQDLQ